MTVRRKSVSQNTHRDIAKWLRHGTLTAVFSLVQIQLSLFLKFIYNKGVFLQ